MSNLHQNNQNNLVSFLRHNQPLPPSASPGLEQQLIDSLEPRSRQQNLRLKAAWAVPKTIATGFLFTCVSFGLRTPRIALEPKDLENFLVKNWHNTLDSQRAANGRTEADWLLPNLGESQPALAVSAQ